MKVLVIDDEEDVRYIVRMSLGRLAEMTVIEAGSGLEGIAMARSERPELILLDMMMPVMHGAAVFRELRAWPETAGIPVIFLTAAALTYEIERLEELGAKGVIRKPFDPLTLHNQIAAILDA